METKKTSVLNTLIFLTVTLMMTACHGKASMHAERAEGDTIVMRHARNLCLIQHADYTEAVIRNPWDTTQVLSRYILTEKGTRPNEAEGTLLKVPFRKAAVFTGVHCALLQELGCEDAIGGVCEVKYIGIPYIQKGVKEGHIADLGNGMAPNMESIMEIAKAYLPQFLAGKKSFKVEGKRSDSIMDLQPDVLMPSLFENNSGYGRLERLGIPIVGCAEYMEASPLAQAEWMRFYGRLFGKGAAADSLFACIEKEYTTLKETAMAVSEKPLVISELPQSGKWFVAAGQSTSGQLYRDAGADYAFAHYDASGSVPLAVEVVLDKAGDSDIWLVKYNSENDKTYSSLLAEYNGYMHFKPFENRNVYACNTHRKNIFEETAFHPERLLRELVALFHPVLLPDYRTVYYEKMR